MQTYEACTQGDCSPLMLLGLLPLIPSSFGNKVDDVFGILPAPKIQKHHLFPQQFKNQFEKIGIKIDELTVELTERLHLQGIHGKGGFVGPGDIVIPAEKWNVLWSDFFKNNPNPSSKEIYQFAGQLMDAFGLSGLPIVPYK